MKEFRQESRRGCLAPAFACLAAACVAIAVLVAGCATVPYDTTVQVDALTVCYADADTIRMIGQIYGHPDVRGLWVPGTRTIYVRPGDTLALGHEMEHAVGIRPPERKK